MSVDTSSCASCGVAEIDEIKLKECGGCDLVKYCSDAQRDHKSQHEEACKKRVAELRDELLFKQPEGTHLGDCPICFLPMPLDLKKSVVMTCCSKMICHGCEYAIQEREAEGCPFCRELLPSTDEERGKQRMKRIEANDPVAMCCEGFEHYKNGDHSSAFEYVTKAAQLGNADAHLKLAVMYLEGHGVEQDKEKQIYHAEEAAIGGDPKARYGLGLYESENDNTERAVKHWTIAARQGYDDSIKKLMDAFKGGFVSKEVLAATLRAHQAAVDETKSPQRDAAEEFYRIQNQRLNC